MRTISQRAVCNDSGEILRETEAGEVFVVTRRGVPVAQLVPYAGGRRAIKPARQDAIFDVSELVVSSIPTATVLDDLRGER
ncbi:type II toxin-antitoxin system Phd/YefM family antitoxin [uncultured Tessaracoccus sp.]|uniref:type II toxin-antitoxin system Phd/YefM family antitoxin n=1 Tax=uncultured Tessaracoccus sp. TaxID=905023 RepID=UPI002628E84C|nr:type II toxin-antitoxin system prevent-host-death family antitoxin [uncultured Tessaracoccus sp.]